MMPGEQNTPLALLASAADRDGRAIAIETAGRRISFAELAGLADATRQQLQQFGVGRGDIVALCINDDLDLCRCLFALWSLGACPAPVNMAQTSEALAAVAAILNPAHAISSEKDATSQPAAIKAHVLGEPSFAATGRQSWPQERPEDLCAILLTSGSSGRPKAVPLSGRQIANNARSMAARLALTPADRIFITTPLYTTSSLLHLLTAMSAGAGLVLERGFQFADRILDLIAERGCTGYGGVPASFLRLSPALEAGRPPPASLRFLMNSGEHLPRPLIERFRRDWPSVAIHCVYGLTEVAGRFCSLDPEKVDRKPGSVGRPLPGMEVTIRDEALGALPPTAAGQIFASGCNLTAGYLGDDAANAAFTRVGFATGDYGYLDEDGDLFVQGRRDDIIKVGGQKVSTQLIEEVIGGLPGVRECAVTVVNDPRLGAVPWVYFVQQPGSDGPEAVERAARQALPPNHVPAAFRAVEEIPRTASGKASRRNLR